MSHMSILGDRLKEAREAADLDRTQASATAHVTPATISNWETGKYEPSARQLTRLADKYGVSVDWLLGRPTPDRASMYDPATTPITADLARKFGYLPPHLRDHARAILDALAAPYNPDRLKHEESLARAQHEPMTRRSRKPAKVPR